MATPTENMLLLQQLFQRPAQEFAQASDARTNLAFKLAAMEREEQLKRDLADMQAGREDARWAAAGTREDARATAAETRQKTQLEALQTREDRRATESERKQGADLDSREQRQIRDTISKNYPTYVDEAENLGEKVRPRSDFDDSVEGLGDLQKELGKLKRIRITRDQDDAVNPAIKRLQQMESEVTAKTKRLEEVRNPSEKDRDLAHLRAVEAVRTFINKGDFGGKKPPSKDQIEKGLAAFDAKELDVAAGFLPGFKPTYDQTYAQMLLAIKNSKSESQDAAIAARDLGDAQKSYNAFSENVWKASGANPRLMKALSERTPTVLQQMQVTLPSDQRTEEEKLRARTPPPGAGTGAPKPTVSAGAPTMGFGGRFGGAFPTTPATGGGFGFGGVPIAASAPTPAPIYGPPANPLLDIQATPSPAGAPYSVFAPTSGSSISDVLLKRPLEREMATFDNIYQGDVPPDAQNRRLQALMQILHGGDYANPQERAVARSQLYQLLGMQPGGN